MASNFKSASRTDPATPSMSLVMSICHYDYVTKKASPAGSKRPAPSKSRMLISLDEQLCAITLKTAVLSNVYNLQFSIKFSNESVNYCDSSPLSKAYIKALKEKSDCSLKVRSPAWLLVNHDSER